MSIIDKVSFHIRLADPIVVAKLHKNTQKYAKMD
jgi:hypothetical protein